MNECVCEREMGEGEREGDELEIIPTRPPLTKTGNSTDSPADNFTYEK